MNRLRIHFVEKEAIGSGSLMINKIGGINNTGERWVISAEKAIEGINNGVWDFYLLENHNEIPVKISKSESGKLSLAAIGDGYLHNLLEDLPEIKKEEVI